MYAAAVFLEEPATTELRLCMDYIEELEQDKKHHTMRVLEEIQDRGFKDGNIPKGWTGTQFTNYIRGLYPEYYTEPIGEK